jgi:hypothetical protein
MKSDRRRASISPAPIESTGIVPTTSTAERIVLAERYNHLLALADRLPAGVAENQVRRSLCELVEAADTEEDHKVAALLNSILDVQRQRGTQQPGAAAIERLLMVLYEDVAVLQAGLFSMVSKRKDSMSETRSSVPGGQPSQATTPLPSYPNITVPFDQKSWDGWRSRGRAADQAFERKLRMLGIVAAVIIGVGSAFWTWL